MIKVGDKVRIIRNRCGASRPIDSYRHYLELLEPGDIIDVFFISGESIWYVVKDGLNNFISLKDVELIEDEDECTCDIIFLVNNGCKCGFLQREKELIVNNLLVIPGFFFKFRMNETTAGTFCRESTHAFFASKIILGMFRFSNNKHNILPIDINILKSTI